MTHWYRNYQKLLESAHPDIVYHGTTLSLWNKLKSEGQLFLTTNKEDAYSYAEEASTRSYYDNGYDENNMSEAPDELKPVVISFHLKQLEQLGLEFEPDWGWVDQLDYVPTWQQSMESVGSFSIKDFPAAAKNLGTIQKTISESKIYEGVQMLYHGTSSLYEKDILKNGIGDPSHWGTEKVAIGFAKQKCRDNGGNPLLIGVPFHDFDQWQFGVDENMIDFPIYDDVEARARKWEASNQDWKACLKIYGAVVYDAPVYVSDKDLRQLISESVEKSNPDYDYYVHTYLQMVANKHRDTNVGAAIYYHKSINPDQSDIEDYYEKTITPYLEKYGYPSAPEGVNDDSVDPKFYEMCDQIRYDWSFVPRPKSW